MTISHTALLELALDLSKNLCQTNRFEAFITTLRTVIQCEAVALLSVNHNVLLPLAQQGLSQDTLGRRFIITDQPRFLAICQSPVSVRFSSDCNLPDPYDGLLLDSDENLPVHACMGIPLYVNNELIGVLTFDSLTPNKFDDFTERSLEVIQTLAAAHLHAALNLDRLEKSVNRSELVLQALTEHTKQHEIIGESPAMQKLKTEIALVGASDFNVLIEGETGVGKELVAHAIHQHSQRANKPLVYVNCAALPLQLIESELFGHVKGAFTGAENARAGKFVIADNGTLFLDEIGELPLSAQSKLLRAIQSNEIQAVGQDKTVSVNVRVIAATNRDLAAEVEKGTFRADLYHRLNVYPLFVPALSARQQDIPLLAGFFIERIKRQLGLPQLKMSKAFLNQLISYHWPGNVRELEHSISRAALKASSRFAHCPSQNIVTLEQQDCDLVSAAVQQIDEHPSVNQQATLNLRDAIDAYQRQIISAVLTQEHGNVAKSAKRLGVDRANLNRLLKRLGVTVIKHVEINSH